MTDEFDRPLMRTGPAVVHGKDHECRKISCAYCSRSIAPPRGNLIKILNMKGVDYVKDRREEILESIYRSVL